MISAVIHTFNEQDNIARCLDSVSFAKEIVIVDMGSTDKTLDIAKKYKCRVYQHPYTGFVEPARNFGIEKAHNDWILIVDADEKVPKSLAGYLKKEAEKSNYDYFRLARKNIIFGKWMKHAGWWPDYQIRFFKKGAVSWVEKIHGIPLTKGEGMDIPSQESLAIKHYNYQSIAQYIERLNRYTTIQAHQYVKNKTTFDKKDILEKPLSEFINRYFIWKGYKDGLHGLSLSILQSISEFVLYLKLWEQEKFRQEKYTLKDFEKYINKQEKLNKYWLVTEMLQNPQTALKNTILRLKRKIYSYG